MNRIRRLCRHMAGLPRPAGALAALAAVAPARWRWPDPPFPPSWKLPPGWNTYLEPPPGWTKHSPLPLGHVAGPVYQVSPRIPAHAAAGGVPGWQIILIAVVALLLAAALAVLIHRLRAARRRSAAGAVPAMTAATPAPAVVHPSVPPWRPPSGHHNPRCPPAHADPDRPASAAKPRASSISPDRNPGTDPVNLSGTFAKATRRAARGIGRAHLRTLRDPGRAHVALQAPGPRLAVTTGSRRDRSNQAMIRGAWPPSHQRAA